MCRKKTIPSDQPPVADTAKKPSSKRKRRRNLNTTPEDPTPAAVPRVITKVPEILQAACSGPHPQQPAMSRDEPHDLFDDNTVGLHELQRDDDPAEASCADCRTAGTRKSEENFGVAKTTVQSVLDAVNAYCEDHSMAHMSPARHASVRAFAANLMENLKNDGIICCTWLYLSITQSSWWHLHRRSSSASNEIDNARLTIMLPV